MGGWDGRMKERAQLRNLWLDVVCRHGSRNAVVDEHGKVWAQFNQLHTSAEEFAKANRDAGCCSSADGNRRAIGLGRLIHPLEIVVARLGCLIGGLVWTMEEIDFVMPSGTTDDDLLYVMCTSGTSTFPKKVKGSAAATLNRVLWFWSRFPLTPGGDVSIARTHPKFVDSVAEVFQALLSGVMIVLPCKIGSLDDPVALLAAVSRFQVTVFTTTPSLLRLTLDVVQDCSKSRCLLNSLHLVCVSGEPLPMEIVCSFAEMCKVSNRKNLELVNLYGSTETAGDVSYCTLNEMLMQPTGELFASIGHPISGVHFHIIPVQSSSSLVEHSGHHFNEGELIVTGVGLSLGYYYVSSVNQRLDEKEHAFFNVNDCKVMLGENHERAYRTGDIVMKGKDGLFFWRGRLDSQVSRRGVNICLEKMECIAKYATHAKQVKMAVHYEHGKQRLFCFVSVLQPVSWVSLQIRKALPSVATPSEVVKVNDAFKWPLATSGKIDRSELLQCWLQNRSEVQEECCSGVYEDRWTIEAAKLQPVVDKALHDVVTAILATRSLSLSKKVSNMLNIWAQRSLPASLELSFEDLGGDSLSAIEAAWRIRKAQSNFEELLPEHLLKTSLDNALEAGRGKRGDASKRKRKWDILSDLGKVAREQHHSTVEECSTKEEIMDSCLPQQQCHPDIVKIAANDKGPSFLLGSKSEISYHGPNKQILMDPLWNIPLRACVDATPAVLQRGNGDVLAFIGSHGGDLVCIDIRTGNVQWTADLGSTRVEVEVALSNDNTMIFVGCYDGRLISLDISCGMVKWYWATNDAIRCPPVSCNLNFLSRTPAVLVGSYARTIDCLKQSNGNLIWRYWTEGQVAASPVYLSHVIYVATTSCPSLVALCEKAGQVLWECTSLSAPIFANMIASSNGKAILCASVDGTVHAVSAGESGGELLWKVQPGGGVWGGVAFNVNRGCQQVIVAGHDSTSCKGMVCSINFETGNITWKLQLEGKVYGACFVLEGYVFVAQTDGLLLAMDIVDGTVVSSLRLLRNGLETFSSPVLVPGPGIHQQHQKALLMIGSRQDALHCVVIGHLHNTAHGVYLGLSCVHHTELSAFQILIF